jgi:hypothetical protein
MSRTLQQLEARLTRVEQELAELKASLKAKQEKPWYLEIAGAFAGDEDYKEIMRLGRLIRQGKLKG